MIITAVRPDLDLLFRRLRYPEQPPRGSGIARGLAEQVASLVPVRRWAEFLDGESEPTHAAIALRDQLWVRLREYEEVLLSHGMQLPYNRTLWPK